MKFILELVLVPFGSARFLLERRKKFRIQCFTTLRDWSAKLAPLSEPMRGKPQPIVSRSHAFPRVLHRLHVFASNSGWFIDRLRQLWLAKLRRSIKNCSKWTVEYNTPLRMRLFAGSAFNFALSYLCNVGYVIHENKEPSTKITLSVSFLQLQWQAL